MMIFLRELRKIFSCCTFEAVLEFPLCKMNDQEPVLIMLQAKKHLFLPSMKN